MLQIIFSVLHAAYIRLVAPPFCVYCRSFLEIEAIFCDVCAHRIIPIVSAQLHVTKTKTVSVYAVSAYKDPIKRLILAKGWRDILASQNLGKLMWEHTSLPFIDFDLIIPIPLHWTRYVSRGYNQAFEMATVLGTKSNKPVASLLKRAQRTQYQAALSAEQRKKNMRKVFEITKESVNLIEGKHILLVDDLMTTGATVQEAAKLLFKYKPKKISVVVAARVT